MSYPEYLLTGLNWFLLLLSIYGLVRHSVNLRILGWECEHPVTEVADRILCRHYIRHEKTRLVVKLLLLATACYFIWLPAQIVNPAVGLWGPISIRLVLIGIASVLDWEGQRSSEDRAALANVILLTGDVMLNQAAVVPEIPVVVTDRSTSPPDGLVVPTPGRLPNYVIRTMTVTAQVLVRAARTYLHSLLGFLTILVFGSMVQDYTGIQIAPMALWSKLVVAAGLALAPTLFSVLQNVAELLARLDETFPKLRA